MAALQKGTLRRDLPRETARQAHSRLQQEIEEKLKRLRGQVDRNAEDMASTGGTSWALVGDLGHVSKTLGELLGEEE